ncbi:mite group 2 allergen-like Ixo r 2 [Rhipicephalus sanguineus]|uniref:mite group 2 allergen-like Ixo r 2 n=1 Tax=Rhipicephalus sanguineus TaxID=34632 RepID=UPI0020C20D7E|nr:mite group 2 allergen-like Ixo r 2 [Rhipicephalus sanguineus]
MKTSFVALALLVSLACAQRGEFKYKDCGSAAKILSVEVEPCDSDPCVFKRSKTTKVIFSLISDQDSDTLTLEAEMKFLGFWVSVPGVQKNLCKRGIKCPIAKGDTIQGSMELDPPWYIPSMKTDVEIKIRGEKGMSVCIRSTVVIG